MDIPATQLLTNEDDDSTHNLIIDLPTPIKRVHQVATLWIGRQKYPIFEGINKVGRNPTSDIVLTDNTVSKNHAEIEAHANSAFVCDLGSSNKTRLDNVILRPQRFYQIEDSTNLTFGNVNASYLYLRGFDNSILIPDTPAPGAKLRHRVTNFSKNSNNSSMNKNDEESIIASTQSQNNYDGVFAIPSPRSRRIRIQDRSTRVQVEEPKVSIHDMATQQYEQLEDVDESIHTCHTQKMSEIPISRTLQSIHDSETQKFDMSDGKNDNAGKQKDEKFTKNEYAPQPTVSGTKSLSDTSSGHHIINETDDESETDEEGVFSNAQIKNAKDNELEKSMNKINESDSETDEDGEFEAMRPHCITSSVNSNNNKHDKDHVSNDITTEQVNHRNYPKSPCLNERFHLQSPILANLDEIRANQTENSIDDVDDDPSLAPTQILRFNGQERMLVSEGNDEIMNSNDDNDDCAPTQCLDNIKKNHETDILDEDDGSRDEMPLTPLKLIPRNHKSVESVKKSLRSNTIPDGNDENDGDDDDTELTQIIEMPKKKVLLQPLPTAPENNIKPSQGIRTPKNKALTKKITKPNHLGNNGNNERIACIKVPRIVMKNNFMNEDDATQIIDGQATIVPTDNKLPTINDTANSAGHIGVSQNVLDKGSVWTGEYFDDTTPTQIIDVHAARTNAIKESQKVQSDAESKNVAGDRKSGNDSDDGNITEMPNREPPVKTPVKKSRKSLRLQHYNTTSLNDSLTKNLANLFGGESDEHKIDNPSPMATQQLQAVLENADINIIKTSTTLQSVSKSPLSRSVDIDSQDVYFAKSLPKRKQNVIESSTESEEENNVSPPTPIGLIFEAGPSGFKDGVAILNENEVGVCESLTKKNRGSFQLQDKVTGEAKTSFSDNKIVHGYDVKIANGGNSVREEKLFENVSGEEKARENEEDDILAGLPEVRIYGTASYPASPTSSVCSLDDLEPFERKRRERLDASAVKRAATRHKTSFAESLHKVPKIGSSDDNKKIESSDDEELDYEDLKKMAVGFIAADARPKKLSIKLEKISHTGNYRKISEDEMKEKLVSSTAKKNIVPQRLRGRPRKNTDYVLSLKDEKGNIAGDESMDETPLRKRVRLSKSSINSTSSSSDPSAESQEVQMILEENTRGERKKRTRKLPKKFRSSEENSMHNQLTPQKSRKDKVDVVDSTSAINRKTNHKVLFTGLAGSNYEAEVKLCGGTIIERSEQATILVTDKIRRTNKFFCAISRHIPIVSEAWIEDSAKQKKFLDWNEYVLEDPATEAKYNFKLRESLEKASRKKLFEGFVFIVTPRVTQPGFDEIKSMVQMCGGKALVRAPKLWLPNTIIISCTEDISKVQDILSKIQGEISPRVHTVEFILLGILKQELDYKANQIDLPAN